MSHPDENGRGQCQHCPASHRLTANGKMPRHKRLRGAREYGAGKVWCEGSGIAPDYIIPPAKGGAA